LDRFRAKKGRKIKMKKNGQKNKNKNKLKNEEKKWPKLHTTHHAPQPEKIKSRLSYLRVACTTRLFVATTDVGCVADDR
jgi:hypothetical protein